MIGALLTLVLLTHNPVADTVASTLSVVTTITPPTVVYIKVDPTKRKRLCQ